MVRQVRYYSKHMAIMASVRGALEGQVIREILQRWPLARRKTSTRLESRIRVSTCYRSWQWLSWEKTFGCGVFRFGRSTGKEWRQCKSKYGNESLLYVVDPNSHSLRWSTKWGFADEHRDRNCQWRLR